MYKNEKNKAHYDISKNKNCPLWCKKTYKNIHYHWLIVENLPTRLYKLENMLTNMYKMKQKCTTNSLNIVAFLYQQLNSVLFLKETSEKPYH